MKANTDSNGEITYYGVTMTVWTHADKDRTATLKECKDKAKKARSGLLSTTGSMSSLAPPSASTRRRATPANDSETEGAMSDSDLESALGRSRGISMATRTSAIESLPEDAAGAFEDGDDLFWMPYALTLCESFLYGARPANGSVSPSRVRSASRLSQAKRKSADASI